MSSAAIFTKIHSGMRRSDGKVYCAPRNNQRGEGSKGEETRAMATVQPAATVGVQGRSAWRVDEFNGECTSTSPTSMEKALRENW